MINLFRRTKKAVTPAAEDSTIGAILLRMRKVTPTQLSEASGTQARSNDHMLGALLVESGAVTQLDVAKALEIQYKMRTGSRIDAELAMLESATTEAAESSLALAAAIEGRKAARRRRGENTGLFLIHPALKTA
jgi:hypothetical protein